MGENVCLHFLEAFIKLLIINLTLSYIYTMQQINGDGVIFMTPFHKRMLSERARFMGFISKVRCCCFAHELQALFS